jgi:hypothetical protein
VLPAVRTSALAAGWANKHSQLSSPRWHLVDGMFSIERQVDLAGREKSGSPGRSGDGEARAKFVIASKILSGTSRGSFKGTSS